MDARPNATSQTWSVAADGGPAPSALAATATPAPAREVVARGERAAAFGVPALLGAVGICFLAFPHDAALSEVENRALAAWPAFTTAALFDGSWARDVDLYVADHFPAREPLVAAAHWLRAHRGPRGITEGTYYAVADDSEAGVESRSDWAPLAPAPVQSSPEPPSPSPAPAPAASAPGEVVAKADDDGEVTKHRGILVYQGRAIQVFGAGAGSARAYAGVINAWHDALNGDVRVYSVIAPTAGAFFMPRGYAEAGKREKTNIDALYGALKGPTGVDAHGEMSKHPNDYMHFRTDHHWTALGAYHAYRAFVTAAGLKPVELDAMTKKVGKPFVGSMLGFTGDASLKKNPDRLEMWLPVTKFKGVHFYKDNLAKAIPDPFLRENSSSYGAFLGGDHALMAARTSVHNGRRVLLVKNSYGNPFGVFLLNSFEEVYIIDYRYFCGSAVDFIRDRKVTDLVFLNGTFTANSSYHRGRIARIMKVDAPPPHCRPVIPPLAVD